jgi:radical SAM superfamily enzyme YgiQ (UPF0313 family)
MKTVLIIPPSPFLGDQKRNPPLGIRYIASFLEKHGYNIELVDLRDLDEDKWTNRIPYADIYGITATTPEYPLAVKIAYKLEVRDKKSLVVLGGFHATTQSKKLDTVFDRVIIGEGELSMLNLLKDYEKGVKKEYYVSPRIEDLDSLPFPARHLLPFDSVINTNLCVKGKPATALIATRGCPYNCAFCASNAMWGKKVRFRSPDNVISEIKEIIERYNVYHFRFHDDTITLNKNWLFELCTKIEPLNIHWRANTWINTSQKDVLEAMYKAGCYEIDYGIEDLSEKVLRISNKKVKVKDMHTAIKNAKEVGLKIRLFFMIGLPGQDRDVAKNIIRFIEEKRPDGVDLSTFVPFPGCDIYKNSSKYNMRILNTNFSDYVMTLGLYGDEAKKDFIYTHDTLTNEELKQKRLEILEYIKAYNLSLNK